MVLGAGGAQTVGHRRGLAGEAAAEPGSPGLGRALVATAGVTKSTVCPGPAVDHCLVSNTCILSSQLEAVRPC